MKKIVALFLALALMLTVVGSAMAATLDNQTTDHSYAAYQIFKGTQTGTAGDTKLGDIEWGDNINGTAFLAALQADTRFGTGTSNIFNACTTAKEVAEALAAGTTDHAKAFANVAANYLTGTATTVAADATTITVDPGYYLFVDTTALAADSNDAMNSALLQITGNDVTIQKKYSVTEVDKDIVLSDDTHVEATDVNIGDTVKYQISGTLPSNYDDYETYYYQFADILSKGQAVAANSIKVYQNSVDPANDVTEKFTIDPSTAIDGTAETNITITNANLKDATGGIGGLTKDDIFIVEYTVTITADAEIGSTGNPNEAKIIFSNNPNYTGSGTPPTGETPPDETLVFTYDLNPTKVDGDDNTVKLEGAQFVLKATSGDHNGKYAQIDAASHKLTGWLDAEPTAVDTAPTSGNTGVLVSAAGGLFEVYGLDAGDYELKEIKAPVGYNLLTSPIAITITATVKTDEDDPGLDALTITVDGAADANDYASTGKLPMTVENNGGVELPETGGIGTTIFYVSGLVMVLGAAAILVARRKAESEA